MNVDGTGGRRSSSNWGQWPKSTVATPKPKACALGEHDIRQLLARLSPDQRDVIVLRVVADLSIDDVARTLGERVGAVKALQHRAIAALRREISGDAVS